jgi:hypothetical protein
LHFWHQVDQKVYGRLSQPEKMLQNHQPLFLILIHEIKFGALRKILATICHCMKVQIKMPDG